VQHLVIDRLVNDDVPDLVKSRLLRHPYRADRHAASLYSRLSPIIGTT
jgi:hypothetical protein